MNVEQPRRRRAGAAAASVVLSLIVAGAAGLPPAAGSGAGPHATAALADPPTLPPKRPTAVGFGGAVSTVDPVASRAALRVLKAGGNATDAAVAAAAMLGVTEPYSAGIGGGGYFVHYQARTGRVQTIDGRETAPATMPTDAFIDPETGLPYRFTPELVTSGVSVGVPGTPATWARALDRWGSMPMWRVLGPAIRVADRGFVVDETFFQQTEDNEVRFRAFTSTRDLFLPGGAPPAVGSVLRNPDLARTYRLLARTDGRAVYRGDLAREIAAAAQEPPLHPDNVLPVPPGYLEVSDLAGYQVVDRAPTRMRYRGYDVYGMAPSSSGGSTVGEALNILERFDLGALGEVDALHHYLEAGALAFADRAAYLGDPAYVEVPLRDLLSDRFAAERACLIDPEQAQGKPVPAGDVTSYDGQCPDPADGESVPDTEGVSTTNLTVADRWGNVVEYTLTIEQTGGSGIVVPGRGFLLNNELTDFSTVYVESDPNRIQPGKRPRSSMSPTIVLRHGRPFLALGSPGGSTIITAVLQILLNRIDLGMDIPDALAAPRAAPRNQMTGVSSEPAFIEAYGDPLGPGGFGHVLVPAGDAFTSAAEIGAATAIEFGPRGRMVAVAEPMRRGGGSALVVRPARLGP